MTKRKEMGTCEQCGKKFLMCRFNKYHQKYCKREICVVKRRRERQCERYRKAYRNDKTFADAERQRCRKGIQKRRQDARQDEDKMPADNTTTPKINFELLATGLLSQWIDSNDPAEVQQTARQLEKRGQQLALAALAASRSTIFGLF